MYVKNSFKIIVLSTLILITACKKEEEQKDTAMSDNLLLKEWTGPFNGVPAFDKMKVEDVKEAIESGIALSLKEIEAIANNTEAPTFENTIAAMERSGKVLDRAFTYRGIFGSNMSTPEFRDISKALAPKISEYSSKISQNEKLLIKSYRHSIVILVIMYYMTKKVTLLI